MKQVIKNTLGLVLIGALLIVCFGFKSVPAKFPDGWIPMFYDQSDSVSCVINTNTISYIEPGVDPEAILSRAGDKQFEYLMVHLTNGKSLKVFEPFDEFVERIRRSQ